RRASGNGCASGIVPTRISTFRKTSQESISVVSSQLLGEYRCRAFSVRVLSTYRGYSLPKYWPPTPYHRPPLATKVGVWIPRTSFGVHSLPLLNTPKNERRFRETPPPSPAPAPAARGHLWPSRQGKHRGASAAAAAKKLPELFGGGDAQTTR